MFTFGIPKQHRETKTEKYPDTPVLTMNAIPVGDGNCAFQTNNKLQELLGLILDGTEYVSIAIADGVARLAVTTGRDVEQYLVRKNGKFSNKPIHNYVTKSLGLDNNVDNDFLVELDTVQDGINIYKLTKI
jgi:hypothetical protein